MRVKGFHGTTKERADAIKAGSFRPSASPEEWLGSGIYFFEGSETFAWAYARMAVRAEEAKGKKAVPALLTADLDLSGCVDLFDQCWNTAIAAVVAQLESAGALPAQHGLLLKTARGANVVVCDVAMTDGFRKTAADCMVINALWSYLKTEKGFEMRSVRAPFAFGRQHCLNSYLFTQSHVQIAVKDADVIHDLDVRT